MNAITDNINVYFEGIVITLKLSAYTAVLSLILGVFIAALKISPIRLMRMLGHGWVHIFQNSPLAVVLFFTVFGFPVLGFVTSYFAFGVGALTCYTSAFMCEAIISGMRAIPRSEIEAGRALAFSTRQLFQFVILPQGISLSIPPIVNNYNSMIKNAAVVGAFGVAGELFNEGIALISIHGYRALPVMAGIIVGYLIIILPLSMTSRYLETRFAIAR